MTQLLLAALFLPAAMFGCGDQTETESSAPAHHDGPEGESTPASEGSSEASWQNATFRVSVGAATSGTLRLRGSRYEYIGDAYPAEFGEAFYFIEHPTGVLSAEVQDDPRVGLVRFDPEGSGYDSMNPRRNLEVRLEDDGTYYMHSIVSEIQQWTIRSE